VDKDSINLKLTRAEIEALMDAVKITLVRMGRKNPARKTLTEAGAALGEGLWSLRKTREALESLRKIKS